MLKILTSRCLTTIPVWVILSACGSATGFSTKQLLSIQIQGVHRVPEGATGDSSPKSLAMKFNRLLLTTDDGTEVDLSPEAEQDVNVINRPQIFFEVDLKEYDGKTFNTVTAGFSVQTEVAGRYKIRPLELSTGSITNSTGFVVQSAVRHLMGIEVEWLNIAYTDDVLFDEVFTQPGFVTTLEND